MHSPAWSRRCALPMWPTRRRSRGSWDSPGAGSGRTRRSPPRSARWGHVTAALDGVLPLEHAVHEVDWRADLIEPAERIEAGRLLPASAGLGAELNENVVRRHGRLWTP